MTRPGCTGSDVGSISNAIGTVCSSAPSPVRDIESSSVSFEVFFCLARLKAKTKPAVTNTASRSMPMIMPAIAPPNSFFSSFDSADGTDDKVN